MSPFEHGEVFVLDDGGEVKIIENLQKKITIWEPLKSIRYKILY